MGNLLCQLLWLFVSFSRDPLSLIPVVRWASVDRQIGPGLGTCLMHTVPTYTTYTQSGIDPGPCPTGGKNGRSKPSNDRTHVATLRRPTLCHGWRQWESLQKSCRCLLLIKWCISLHQPFSHRLSDLSPLQCPGMPRHSTKNVKKHVCSTYTFIHGYIDT